MRYSVEYLPVLNVFVDVFPQVASHVRVHVAEAVQGAERQVEREAAEQSQKAFALHSEGHFKGQLNKEMRKPFVASLFYGHAANSNVSRRSWCCKGRKKGRKKEALEAAKP